MNMQLEYLEVDSFQEQKDAEHKGYRHVTTKGDGRYMVIVMCRPKRKKKTQKPYVSIFQTLMEMGIKWPEKRKMSSGVVISYSLVAP